MAELVLSTVGQALGARVAPAAFRAIGATLGRTAGSAIGRSIDAQLFGETRRSEGPRLTDLHLQGSTEGASIPTVYGRTRIAGQVIWAARFKEHIETTHAGGGKGGGPRVTSTNYRYTLSFAIGLCEGEIARIGRAWANGEAFDLTQVSWRLYRGTEDQAPDVLIEAIEGAEHAPAYRGLAYIVFEDLPLEAFGNTIPQLSFEIVRPPPSASPGPRFEERVKGVCLIPGAGEFVYATEPVYRLIGPGAETAENVHAERARANLLVSLDQLAVDLPNVESVLLVVAWFGNDLRCGECVIRPGVEIADKETSITWRAGDVAREDAHVVSQHDGAPAFGGTPSDASVLQAIAELKARGYQVGLYPFLLMDVPADNALPDPYGAAAQAAYPWRGRITLHPAAGEDGSPDQSADATPQVDAFFGDAALEDFDIDGDTVAYDGPDEWSYRRLILHNAKLAEAAGGVDFFVIGSEMRGLTTVRDDVGFPAVDALRDLAADVRATLDDDTTITYAADWSEYFGHQPLDGSGDVLFHLDPLWADDNIDVIGVDWYPPLTDWRDGSAHLDAALARSIYDPDYLAGRIEAGEDYDFFYVSDEDGAAQDRSEITDGAHAEPWIFRAKDIRNFWSRAHHNRPNGVRDASPTAWVPQSKPVWFVELGCPAVDKGANAPNLFIDDKSSESALPPFSSGARDDLIQRRALEAYLRYWDADGENNPASTIDARPMIERAFVWAWDARPHPAFPARDDVWADGGAWRLGHWLNGRAGLGGLGDVVADICARAGVEDADVSTLSGAISGYVVDSPATARAALEPLMTAFAFDAREHEGAIAFFHAVEEDVVTVSLDDFTADSSGDTFAGRADAADLPIEARVRFLDASRDYALAGVSARRLDRAEGGVATLEAPLVLEAEAAEGLAERMLAEARANAETLRIGLGPAHLALEPGDRVALAGTAGAFEIARIEDAEARRLNLRRATTVSTNAAFIAEPSAPSAPKHAPTPALSILDLAPLPGAEDDDRPLAAVFASPWLGTHAVYAGASDELLSQRGSASQAAVMGELMWALYPGPASRWDEGNVVRIKLYGGTLASVTKQALLNGENAFAIESDDGWEVIQARNAVLVAPNEYELSGFLRGQLGSEPFMASPAPVGARIIKLDARLARLEIGAHEWNEVLAFAAPPQGAAASDERAARETATLPHAALRPWSPAHLRAKRVTSGDVAITWVRRARVGGDAWGPGEPPLGAPSESYRLEILDGGDVIRSIDTSSPDYLYLASEQTADFGSPPVSLRLRVAQLGESGAPGLNKELTIPL